MRRARRTVFLTTTTADEEVNVYRRFGYFYKGKMYMPRNYSKPDYSGSNQIIVVRQPDGSVVEVQLVITYPEYVNGNKSVVGVIPQIGDNDTLNARQNIFGVGNRYGSHFGSGLPALGGTLRTGELSGSVSIDHALNLLLPPEILNGSSGGYRWPATNADEGYGDSYLGGNTAARMGCLLALPQTFDVNQLASPEARRVATALKDYGGYCTDGAANNVFQIAMEESEFNHLQNNYGTDPDNGTPWSNDQRTILSELQIVNNNGPDTIGGGYSGPYNGQHRIRNLDRRTQRRVDANGRQRRQHALLRC
ncbi:MAG: hypothetical protein H7Y38_17785 [Armatimonadetes bacterium]|nr:hypothetical protein [Armatimonadota bacterium]